MSTTTPLATTEVDTAADATDTAAPTAADHDDHGEHDEHVQHGLSDFGYVKVALLLAVLTGAEVLTYFYDFGGIEIPALLILMVVKFEIVVAYFMHLRFDSKLFTWFFALGLILAASVYAAMATTLVFWSDPAGCDAGTFC